MKAGEIEQGSSGFWHGSTFQPGAPSLNHKETTKSTKGTKGTVPLPEHRNASPTPPDQTADDIDDAE